MYRWKDVTCGVDGLQDFVLFGLVFSHSFHVRFEIIARTHMVGLPCRTVISFESVLIGVFDQSVMQIRLLAVFWYVSLSQHFLRLSKECSLVPHLMLLKAVVYMKYFAIIQSSFLCCYFPKINMHSYMCSHQSSCSIASKSCFVHSICELNMYYTLPAHPINALRSRQTSSLINRVCHLAGVWPILCRQSLASLSH